MTTDLCRTLQGMPCGSSALVPRQGAGLVRPGRTSEGRKPLVAELLTYYFDTHSASDGPTVPPTWSSKSPSLHVIVGLSIIELSVVFKLPPSEATNQTC